VKVSSWEILGFISKENSFSEDMIGVK
jgi:hypothetical protein